MSSALKLCQCDPRHLSSTTFLASSMNYSPLLANYRWNWPTGTHEECLSLVKEFPIGVSKTVHVLHSQGIKFNPCTTWPLPNNTPRGYTEVISLLGSSKLKGWHNQGPESLGEVPRPEYYEEFPPQQIICNYIFRIRKIA